MMPSIRLFQPEEYDDVVNLWKLSGLILSLSDQKDELLKLFERNSESFFIMELQDKIIGTVIAAWDGRRGYIHHMAIHPEFQGRGFGKLLMSHCESYYMGLGAVKIHLMIERENEKVVRFYREMDWEIRDDLILMTKTLRNH